MCSPRWETEGGGRNPKVNRGGFHGRRGFQAAVRVGSTRRSRGAVAAGRRGARPRVRGLPLKGARAGQSEAAAAMAALADGYWRAWPAGPARARAGWVGPQARPNPIDRFFFFFKFIFNAKTNSRKV
jgi:hypothetical protein